MGRPARRWLRAAPAGVALALAIGLVLLIPLRWTGWTAGAAWQKTDDAQLRADITPLSAKVGGYVRRVAVTDFARVKAGDVLVEIADDDYRAALAQAQANVAAAQAAIANNLSQQALQRAQVQAAQAAVGASMADLQRYRLEQRRQHTLMRTEASSEALMEQADANTARTSAQAAQARAQATAQARQVDVLKSQALQLAAALDAQRALLRQAQLNVGYTRITAPVDGEVGERLVRPGQLVSAGSQVITVTPLPHVWVVANYKETQLARVLPGQPARVSVDAAPGVVFTGRVDRVSPASGSQFALLAPDNASGNYTKVVQRVPVKIVLDPGQKGAERLRPGLSVIASIDTRGAPAR